MQTIRAFVSSTWIDLQDERAAVERVLQRFRQTRFVGMEYFGTRDDGTRDTSLHEVDGCALYIGVIGHRYGSGITEDEYRRARTRQLPCLVYLKSDGASAMPDDPDARLATWKEELRARHTVATFSTAAELAERLAVDLHNWLFDKYIVEGIAAVAAPAAERIQHFLAEYAGTPDQPVPFGGRERDFASLTEWLDDDLAPPQLMLAAPAGRGKSALLVRWSRSLVTREELAIVFFPVSIRFNTNLANAVFSSLAARLAELHREPLQVPAGAAVDQWRALVANYLGRPLPDGRRLLLILDGIDEAADWEATPDLFPYALARGTKIVVSARYLAEADANSWLRRLGWDQSGRAVAMSLDALTLAGVADVLARSAVEIASLSTRIDLVVELHRLSEGDPLLVRLYVTALSGVDGSAHLDPEDLPQIAPGLTGFFNRWWDDQRRLWGAQTPLREPAVQAVLNCLACALGPLEQDDLLHLTPAIANLNAWTLEDAFRPINRFVVGDGHTQGYAFSHPRLGSFFYDRLQRAGEARQHEARFVAWGKDTLAALHRRELEATAVPAYLIQYLRPHLERTGGGVDALRDLVSSEWLSAWSVLDKGSFTGFLTDVRRVWQAAEQADADAVRAGRRAPFIDLEVRCALCLSSVFSMAEEIPAAVLVGLVKAQAWTPDQGLLYASNISDARRRVEALLELTSVVDAGDGDRLLGAALSSARSAEDLVDRDALLCEVASHLRDPLAALRHVESVSSRLQAISWLAVDEKYVWQQIDTLVEAIDDAQTLADSDLKQQVLWGLTRLLPEPHAARARAAAIETIERRLGNEDDLAGLAWSDQLQMPLVSRLIERIREKPTPQAIRDLGYIAGKSDDPSAIVAMALDLASSAPDDTDKSELLLGLFQTVPIEYEDAVLERVRLLGDPSARLRVLCAAASRGWGDRRLSRQREALAALRQSAGDDEPRAQAVLALLPDLPQELVNDAVALLVRAAEPARRIEWLRSAATHPVAQSAALNAIVEALPHLSPHDVLPELQALCEQLAGLGDDVLVAAVGRCVPQTRFDLAIALASSLPLDRRREALEEALAAVPVLGGEKQVVAALRALAPLLDDALVRRAMSLARGLGSARARVDTLRRLAPRLSASARAEVVLDTVAAVRNVTDPRIRADMLCRLAVDATEGEQAGLFQAAVRSVEMIESEDAKAKTLLDVARLLPGHYQSQLRGVARTLTSVESRVEVLAELSFYGDDVDAALEAAAAEARAIASPTRRAQVCRNLAMLRPEATRQRLLEDVLRDLSTAATEIGDDGVETFRTVLEALPPALFEAGLQLAESQPSGDRRARLLGALANAARTSPSHVNRLLAAVAELPDAGVRILALRDIVTVAQGALPDTALAEAFESAMKETDVRRRTRLLVDLASSLPPPLTARLMAMAESSNDEWERGQLLRATISTLRPDEKLAALRRAFANVQRLSSDAMVSWARLFADVLPKQIFDDVLEAIADANQPARAVVVLRSVAAACRDPRQRDYALASALHAARLLPTLSDRLEAFQSLGRAVAAPAIEDLLLRAFATSSADAPDAVNRVLDLAGASPRLLEAAFQFVLKEEGKVPGGKMLAARLPETRVPHAILQALNVYEDSVRESMVTALLARYQANDRPWGAILDLIRSAESRTRTVVLRLLPYLPAEWLAQVFSVARTLTVNESRAGAFRTLVGYVQGPSRDEALAEAWRAARQGVSSNEVRGLIDTTLTMESVSSDVLEDAVASVLAVADKGVRRDLVTRLAPRLPPALLVSVLTGLQVVRDESERADVLLSLAPFLGGHAEGERTACGVVTLADAIASPPRRAAALAVAAGYLPDDVREGLRRRALSVEAPSESVQADILCAVAPTLAGASEQLVADALRLAGRVPQPEAVVTALLPVLPAPLLAKAFALGGVRSAETVERVRLLAFAMQVEGASADEAMDAVTGANEEALREVILRLRGGTVALSPAFAQRHLLSPEITAACGQLCEPQDTQRVLRLALTRAAADPPLQRIRTLVELAPGLPSSLVPRLLDLVAGLGNDEFRASALRRLAPLLAANALPYCLPIVTAIQDEGLRERTASRLMLLLADPLPAAVVAAVRSIRDAAERAECLAALALRSTGRPQLALAREALEALRAMRPGADRARILCTLAAATSVEVLSAVVSAVPSIENEQSQAEALASVVPALRERHFDLVFDQVRAFTKDGNRVLVLCHVMRVAPDGALTTALAAAEKLKNGFSRAEVLLACAPRIPERLLPVMLTAAAALENPGARVNLLAAVTHHAGAAVWLQAAANVCGDLRQVADESYRCHLLTRIARHLPDAVLDDALAVVEGIGDEFFRAVALKALATHTPARLSEAIQTAAMGIQDGRHRAAVVAHLADRHPSDRAAGVAAAIEAAAAVPGRVARAETLRELALDSAEPAGALSRAALDAALAVERPDYVATAVAELAPVLSADVLIDALEAVFRLPRDVATAALIPLAPFVPESAFARVIAFVRGAEGPAARLDLCCALAPYVPQPQWPDALSSFIDANEGTYRGDALIACAPHAPSSLAGRFVAAAAELPLEAARVKALRGLIPHLPTDALRHVRDTVEQLVFEPHRPAILDDVARVSTPETAVTATAPMPESDDAAVRQLLRVATATGVASAAAPPAEVPLSQRRPRFAVIRHMESECDKVVTLKALARDMADEDVPQALQCIRELESDANRAEALHAFIDWAPNDALPDAWSVLRDIRSSSLRLRPMEALATRMAALEGAQAHALWCDILRFLANRHRARLLDGVRVLAPTLSMVGADGAVQRTALSIDEICGWWP